MRALRAYLLPNWHSKQLVVSVQPHIYLLCPLNLALKLEIPFSTFVDQTGLEAHFFSKETKQDQVSLNLCYCSWVRRCLWRKFYSSPLCNMSPPFKYPNFLSSLIPDWGLFFLSKIELRELLVECKQVEYLMGQVWLGLIKNITHLHYIPGTGKEVFHLVLTCV